MTCQSPIEPAETVALDFDRVRGRLIAAFAKAELAVSETLIDLSRLAGAGKVDLPHLVGARMEGLQKLLSADGVTAPLAKGATQALTAFRKHDELRRFLCHGVVSRAIASDGHSLWIIRMRVLSGCAYRDERWWLADAELAHLLATVARDAQRLSDRLAVLRRKLAEPKPKAV